MKLIRREAEMQVNAHSGSDDHSAEPQLVVDVQVGDYVALPDGCDFAAIAKDAISFAHKRGWATQFSARAGDVSEIELCIRVVSALEGAALNEEWRGKPAATNILSFTADIVAGHFASLGDLVLCLPVVEREAIEQGKTQIDHLSHLVVHGVLHLLGYDHVEETEANAMEAMEVAMLAELGIDNPYE